MKIELIDKEKLQKRSHETELIDEMNRRNLYDYVENHGFDIRVFLYSNGIGSEKNKFNMILRGAKHDLKISMYDMVVYIAEDFSTIRLVFMALDDENKQIVKNELLKEFNVKL